MTIKRFEDLECWQESRVLTQSVYAYTNQPKFSQDYRLPGQINGAAISVMNNICEGFDSATNKDFIRFLTYSRRSCSEIQDCLYVALDHRLISEIEFSSTNEHCAKVRKIVDGLIRYLKKDSFPPNHRRTGP